PAPRLEPGAARAAHGRPPRPAARRGGGPRLRERPRERRRAPGRASLGRAGTSGAADAAPRPGAPGAAGRAAQIPDLGPRPAGALRLSRRPSPTPPGTRIGERTDRG